MSKEFSEMLDSVRCFPTERTLMILKDRIIQTRPSDKFKELQESGQSLVCLFATRLACDQFNTEMLNSLCLHCIKYFALMK